MNYFLYLKYLFLHVRSDMGKEKQMKKNPSKSITETMNSDSAKGAVIDHTVGYRNKISYYNAQSDCAGKDG